MCTRHHLISQSTGTSLQSGVADLLGFDLATVYDGGGAWVRVRATSGVAVCTTSHLPPSHIAPELYSIAVTCALSASCRADGGPCRVVALDHSLPSCPLVVLARCHDTRAVDESRPLGATVLGACTSTWVALWNMVRSTVWSTDARANRDLLGQPSYLPLAACATRSEEHKDVEDRNDRCMIMECKTDASSPRPLPPLTTSLTTHQHPARCRLPCPPSCRQCRQTST